MSRNCKKQNFKYSAWRMRIHHTDQLYTDDQIKTNLKKIIVIWIGVQMWDILKLTYHTETKQNDTDRKHKSDHILQNRRHLFENVRDKFFHSLDSFLIIDFRCNFSISEKNVFANTYFDIKKSCRSIYRRKKETGFPVSFIRWGGRLSVYTFSHLRIKNLLADTERFWCYFQKFICIDEVNCLLQTEYSRRCKAECFICA